MTYNWPKIVQGKSVKELYSIANGETMVPNEAIIAAKQEIENRGLRLHDSERIKNKIELESLIEERDEGKSFFGRLFLTSSRVWLRQFIGGILITIFSFLNLIFDFSKTKWEITFIYFLFPLLFTFYSYYQYKKTRKREQFIRNRISGLEDKMKKEDSTITQQN